MLQIFIGAYWLSLNIYYEARNQPVEGMVAVGHVTMNRHEIKNVPIKDTVLKPFAFSWVNTNDPQKFIPMDLDAFEKATEAAWVCIDERFQGKDLYGATHYYNPKAADPVWAHMPEQYPVVTRVGDHIFLKGAF